MSEKKTLFRNEDVRLLRETLCWVMKKSPPQVYSIIDQKLKQFAFQVSKYCQCEEIVFVKAENKNACLNCGKRHEIENDKPNLEIV